LRGLLCLLLLPLLLPGWSRAEQSAGASSADGPSADELLIVHCSLPGQIRQLGTRTTYVSPRRPARLSALECRVRGGEYVVNDEASLSTALGVWLDAAQAGDPEAQTTLAEVFAQGLGTPPDFEAAALWYRRAAEQDYARAMIGLGTLYERGQGVPQDMAEALGWYRRASGLPAAIQLEPTRDVAPLAEAERRDRARLTDSLTRLETQLADLRDDLQEARAALAQSRQRVAELEAAADDRSQDQQTQLAARERQIAELTAATEQRQRRLDELRTQLATVMASRDELTGVEGRVGQLEAALAAERRAAQEAATERDRLAGEVAAQRQSLAERDAALAREFERAERLLADLERIEAERATQPDPAPAATALLAERQLAGPSLALVEPQLPTTRGLVKVSLAPEQAVANATRQIIGRVVAPAGLLSLTVNSEPVTANAAGVFTYPLRLRAPATAVQVVAVDAQGKRAELDFELVSQAVEAVPGEPASIPRAQLGSFHALLVANSRYEHLPDLVTPRQDVERLARLLEQRYGFTVTTLFDASRYQLLSALNELRGQLTSEDNLLIYYAGHGELDRTNMRGHWLPVDAEPTSSANWLSNVAVTDIVNVMTARQVMLVVDSCYAGSLTRSSLTQLDPGLTDEERRTWLELMARKRSRVVLTSGGLAPVLDAGGGRHSVFARALVEVLEANAELLTGRLLYEAVAARVAHAASRYDFEQIPQYAPMARAGHEAGDFLLLPSG